MLAVYMVVALYTCFIGTFLAVFVPQACYVSTGGGRNATAAAHDCTFAENVYIGLDPYNVGTLLLNLVTFLVLVVGFVVEYHRERWIIAHLDVDSSLPDTYLDTILTGTAGSDAPGVNGYDSNGPGGPIYQQRRQLHQTLFEYNKHYKKLFEWIAPLMLGNIVVSGVLVFMYWYRDVRFFCLSASSHIVSLPFLAPHPATQYLRRPPPQYRTATTFITSVILVGGRIVNSIYVSRYCQTNSMAQSVNLVSQLTFNTVAPPFAFLKPSGLPPIHVPAAVPWHRSSRRNNPALLMYYSEHGTPHVVGEQQQNTPVQVGTVV